MTTGDSGEWQPRPIRRIGERPPQRSLRRNRPPRSQSEPAPFDPQPTQPPTPASSSPPSSAGRQTAPPPSGASRAARAASASTVGRGAGWLIVLVIAALLVGAVIVLFFEPGLVETNFNTDDAEPFSQTAAVQTTLFESRLSEDLPPIPEILGAVSPIYEFRAPQGRLGPFEFSLNLTSPTQDPRNLGVYTWNGDDWARLGDARLGSDGSTTRIELSQAPDNLVILRRLQFRDVIAGRIPRGEEPQAILAGSLTLVHPDGWSPGADGSLLGGVDQVNASIPQNRWPTVFAAPEQADLVNDILASDNLRRQHIANIQHAIKSGLHDGVDIHYLNVSPALQPQFTSFISELADRLHREDRGIAVHIPLTASGGVGEGGYDLSQLGAAADFIVLEPPLDPTLFDAAISASLPTILERIEARKILLALRSNAVVREAGGFREISRREALRLASLISIREPGPYRPGRRVTLQGNSIQLENLSGGLRWDNVNRIATFTYPDQTGAAVTVWIHNRFSASFRLRVVSEYELGGVYISNASADPANAELWPAVAAFFESGQPDLRLPNEILFDPVFSVEAGELSGASGSGWQFWDLPSIGGDYRAQLVISDGDVRVGNVITVPVRAAGAE